MKYWPTERTARTVVKRLCHSFGFDVVRLRNASNKPLAGLRQRPIGTVIDCGANAGQFAREISQVFPEAALYCFEPLQQPFEALSVWAATQRGRVKCFQVALGERNGEALMHSHTEHSPSSSLLATTQHEESTFPQTRAQADIHVPVTTLDEALVDDLHAMRPQILLKLDVQGYEDRVLRGAARILPRVHACMLEVGVDPLYVAQAAFKDIVTLLDQFGLTYAGNIEQVLGPDGRVMWLDALFLRHS
jgi:FkbM family methyltransferase